jgi:hypothetical protein
MIMLVLLGELPARECCVFAAVLEQVAVRVALPGSLLLAFHGLHRRSRDLLPASPYFYELLARIQTASNFRHEWLEPREQGSVGAIT